MKSTSLRRFLFRLPSLQFTVHLLFIHVWEMREEEELPHCSVLKSCANPDLWLKMLLPYLQRTIPILRLFDLLTVTLKLTSDELLWGKLALFFTVKLWEGTAERLKTAFRQHEERPNTLIRIQRWVFGGVSCVLEGSKIIWFGLCLPLCFCVCVCICVCLPKCVHQAGK